jgi:hypothetical protein
MDNFKKGFKSIFEQILFYGRCLIWMFLSPIIILGGNLGNTSFTILFTVSIGISVFYTQLEKNEILRKYGQTIQKSELPLSWKDFLKKICWIQLFTIYIISALISPLFLKLSKRFPFLFYALVIIFAFTLFAEFSYLFKRKKKTAYVEKKLRWQYEKFSEHAFKIGLISFGLSFLGLIFSPENISFPDIQLQSGVFFLIIGLTISGMLIVISQISKWYANSKNFNKSIQANITRADSLRKARSQKIETQIPNNNGQFEATNSGNLDTY